MNEKERELSIYPLVAEYFAQKSQTLRNDYRTKDGKYSESCTEIACDLAELLLQGKETPSLITVRGDEVRENGWVHNKLLVPKVYGGRISWGAHVVCVLGDLVFDPMVGKIMRVGDYKREVFTEPVNLEEAVPSEFIGEFLQRGKAK